MITSSKCRPRNSAGRLRVTIHRTRSAQPCLQQNLPGVQITWLSSVRDYAACRALFQTRNSIRSERLAFDFTPAANPESRSARRSSFSARSSPFPKVSSTIRSPAKISAAILRSLRGRQLLPARSRGFRRAFLLRAHVAGRGRRVHATYGDLRPLPGRALTREEDPRRDARGRTLSCQIAPLASRVTNSAKPSYRVRRARGGIPLRTPPRTRLRRASVPASRFGAIRRTLPDRPCFSKHAPRPRRLEVLVRRLPRDTARRTCS